MQKGAKKATQIKEEGKDGGVGGGGGGKKKAKEAKEANVENSKYLADYWHVTSSTAIVGF